MGSGKPEVSAELDQGPRGAGFPANRGRVVGSGEARFSSFAGAGVLYLIGKTFWGQGVDFLIKCNEITVPLLPNNR